jgi:hypothetical protein
MKHREYIQYPHCEGSDLQKTDMVKTILNAGL